MCPIPHAGLIDQGQRGLFIAFNERDVEKGKKGREGILALQSNFFFNSILRLLYIYFFVATNIMSGNSWEQPVRRVFSDWMIFEENDT